MLSFRCDVSDAMREVEDLLGKDLPFAIALFLTKEAQSAQSAVKATLPRGKGQIFQTRNDWTERGIRITPATKQTPVAEVYTDTSNRQTGAPDYLLRQEDGGERVPVNGREHIAIPEKALWRLVGGEGKPIPDWLRPKAMLAYAKKNGTYTVLRGRLKGNNRNAPVPVREMYFFKVDFASGASGILARHVSAPRDQVYVMYIFVTRAHIRKRFHMAETVEKQLLGEVTDENWNQALAQVLATKYVTR